jgi:hypothetical protein
MSYFEKMVSDDANRCGSPVHNRRLQISPAEAETLKCIMDGWGSPLGENQSHVISVDDDFELNLVVKEDGVGE